MPAASENALWQAGKRKFIKMITAEQIKELRQRVETLDKCLNIDGKRQEVAEKQKKTLEAGFWDDPKEAEKYLKELSGVKSWVTGYDEAASAVADLDVLYEFAKESADTASEDVETAEMKELAAGFKSASELVENLELKNMLGEEGDSLGAILTTCLKERMPVSSLPPYSSRVIMHSAI